MSPDIYLDYKLLRILVGASLSDAQLYSTNTNSWKEIQVPKSVRNFWPFQDSKFIHTRTGVLYLGGINTLLSFDPHNEVFGEYPFPSYANHMVVSNVVDFDGSVALILASVLDDLEFCLWTLDDVCSNVAWVKKFRLEPDGWISRITLYLGAGQFVAKCIYDGRYYFYDNKKKKTKQLPLPPRPRDVMSVIKYNESLVSPEGFEKLD